MNPFWAISEGGGGAGGGGITERMYLFLKTNTIINLKLIAAGGYIFNTFYCRIWLTKSCYKLKVPNINSNNVTMCIIFNDWDRVNLKPLDRGNWWKGSYWSFDLLFLMLQRITFCHHQMKPAIKNLDSLKAKVWCPSFWWISSCSWNCFTNQREIICVGIAVM